MIKLLDRQNFLRSVEPKWLPGGAELITEQWLPLWSHYGSFIFTVLYKGGASSSLVRGTNAFQKYLD